jgi:hypothetical protein
MPWWDTDYTTMFNQRTSNRVAQWPLPNGARIDARFKFIGSDPPCASRASRHLFTWRPFPGGTRYFALIDVAYAGTPGELRGDTGEDPNGRKMEVVITDHQIGNPHPEYSQTGISYKFILSLPGKTDWQHEWFWPSPPMDGFGPCPISLIAFPFSIPPARTSNDDVGLDTAWESSIASPIDWYTFSECATPEGQPMVFPQNFARFNGDDAYIALSQSVANFGNAFRVECDIRFQEFITWMPIWGNFTAGGFFGMDQSDSIFGALRLATTWAPVLNVWYHYRYDFEQDGQLKHQLFMDGGEVMNRTTNRQFMSANRLGVYRQGGLGVIWGGFDLKFLTYRKGTQGAFLTQLDMPLQENALDHGPFANHGTTFNMELPSV